MKVGGELSPVPGIGDLSGRKVHWGDMAILRGALGDRGLHDTIARRLPYFKIHRARERAEVFIFSMALIFRFVKPFILATLTRTVCNAHPTARRFPKGGSHSACRFGCYAVGGDCVLHYPFCPIVLDFVSENLGDFCMSDLLWVVNFSVPHCFLLEKVYIGDLIRTAIWRGVISHSANSRRAASAASASAWLSSSSDTLRARLRTVYTRVPSARRAVEGTLIFP